MGEKMDFRNYTKEQLFHIATQLSRAEKVKHDLLSLAEMLGDEKSKNHNHFLVNAPSKEALQDAEKSQYSEIRTQSTVDTERLTQETTSSSPDSEPLPSSLKDLPLTSASMEFLDKARFVPMRPSYQERVLLRLVDGAMHVSTYTDRVDALAPGATAAAHGGNGQNTHRKLALLMKQMCAVLSGLVLAHDYSAGQALMRTRDFAHHKLFFQSVFEIARRYKILNPERMREGYGKMMHVLQDVTRAEVRDLLNFNCILPVRTVFDTLARHPRGLKLLQDPHLKIATMEIIPGKNESQWDIQRAIKRKEAAVKKLVSEYGTSKNGFNKRTLPSSSYGSSSSSSGTGWMGNLGLESSSSKRGGSESSRTSGQVESSSSSRIYNDEYLYEPLDGDTIQECIYSLGDHNTYLRFNRDPCDRLIGFLKEHFSPRTNSKKKSHIDCHIDKELSLSIEAGQGGARLSHSHERQYSFVLQSLMLWRDVLDNMFQLWHLAEEDLLDKENPYELSNTGQGLQRVQRCPRVQAAMKRVVEGVQKKVGVWIGSSQIHLGDRNVPNGLMFIDKYTQIPRILGPIVLCLDKIPHIPRSSTETQLLVDGLGGPKRVQKLILADFFRHAFDGSGADNFFDAGSCIDGRLTSAWNWCSNIHEKSYYPIFLLTGFTGFDGKEGW